MTKFPVFLTILTAVLSLSLGIAIQSTYAQEDEASVTSKEIRKTISTSNPDLSITSVSDSTEGENLHIAGEVLNTSTDIQLAKLTATIYDASNNVIGTDTTYTNPAYIPPNDSRPFQFSIKVSGVTSMDDISSYELHVSSG